MQFLTASESKLVLKRLWTIVKPYWVSPQGKKAWMLLVGVLAVFKKREREVAVICFFLTARVS